MSRSEGEQREVAYTFGESDLAARRLELVAEVFAPVSRAFLAEAVNFRPRIALDLGCGPGHTTRLIADTLGPAETVGIERSAAFLSEARTTARSGVSFIEGDVTNMPLRPGEADLIYARFLLAHLSQPEAAVRDWVNRLHPDGLLLLEEVEWIRTEHPSLGHYLEVLEAMMAHHDNELYIGPRLETIRDDDLHKSRVTRLQPTIGQAARMFSMNLANWRESAFVQSNYAEEEIDHLEAELSKLGDSREKGEICWGLRQIVLTPTEPEKPL